MTLIVIGLSLVPLLGVLISTIAIFLNPTKWRTFLPLLVYGFFIGAYAFMPPDERYDLYRYLPLIEQYGKLSFIEGLKMDGDILYASHIFFWICGHLQLPHLVPAITTASVYGAAFYMTCDTAERYKGLRYLGLVIVFQAAMMPYVMIINNVRNVFSLVIVALAVYLDLIKNNRKWYVWLLYIIGTLFHLSAFVFVVFRILCRYTKKLYGLVVLFPLFFSTIILFLYSNIGRIAANSAIGASIRGIIWKLYGYMAFRDADYAVQSLKSITVRIDRGVMIIGMVMAIIILYFFLRKGSKYIKDDTSIYNFIGMIAVMTISLNIFAMPNFWRFAAAFYAVSGIIAIPLLVAYHKMPLLLRIEPFVYACMGGFCLLFQYVRYDMGVILDWFTTGLLTNWVTILVEFMIAI